MLSGILSSVTWKSFRSHLNFYRVHLLFFTLTPLIFSAILYASNGKYPVTYTDALFNSVSAMTVCGLATINLSMLTGWQQAILFIQMCLGSPVLVSWFMVLIRRHYFAKKFEYLIEAETLKRAEIRRQRTLERVQSNAEQRHKGLLQRIKNLFQKRPEDSVSLSNEPGFQEKPPKQKRDSVFKGLHPNMIRRMDATPQLVDPNGWISQSPMSTPMLLRQEPSLGQTKPETPNMITTTPLQTIPSGHATENFQTEERNPENRQADGVHQNRLNKFERRNSLSGVARSAGSPENTRRFSRTQTIEFARTETRPPLTTIRSRTRTQSSTRVHEPDERRSNFRRERTSSFARYPTNRTNISARAKHSDFGGFPMPFAILRDLIGRFFPQLERRLTRTVTMPRMPTMASYREDPRSVPYISFDAIVGRNSSFPLLTNEQLEEIGGVEYRALNALLWIVAGYHIGIHLFCFVIIAPYMSMPKWRSDFEPPQLYRYVPPAWFSIYQIVSAYTNTGTSLVDQSMVPFQKAYPMIILMVFLILAGNTAFPVFLRFLIWIITKCVPRRSRLNETLHFLLDHPRRCFIYLFPSHQTWFLLTVLVILNCTDWFFFMVLDIGNPAVEVVPLGTRFVIGLLQAAAVRAAGFATVTLSALAPAVKVLYLIMMYVSIYPIAMSVRSTNVYEERSLGVFQENDDDDDDEEIFHPSGSRIHIWSQYLTMHARKQLAFDMWWLGLALFLVCIIERDNLEDTENASWFNIFTIMFEIVSAYGTVGLSLGLPNQNYSFSGALRPLSKLIICLVMLRGRHRGLPVAIDRAVMLPFEFKKSEEPSPESTSTPEITEGPLQPGRSIILYSEHSPSDNTADHTSS